MCSSVAGNVRYQYLLCIHCPNNKYVNLWLPNPVVAWLACERVFVWCHYQCRYATVPLLRTRYQPPTAARNVCMLIAGCLVPTFGTLGHILVIKQWPRLYLSLHCHDSTEWQPQLTKLFCAAGNEQVQLLNYAHVRSTIVIVIVWMNWCIRLESLKSVCAQTALCFNFGSDESFPSLYEMHLVQLSRKILRSKRVTPGANAVIELWMNRWLLR